MAGSLPNPTFRERMLVLEGLLARVNEYLETTAKHPAVAGTLPQPRTFNEFRDVLWMLHVIENRLLSARRCAEHAAELARKVGPRTRKRLSEADNELIRACESDAVETIARQQQAVEELEMELRLERLEHSLKALEDPELSRDRFLATYGVNIDARILTEFLNENAASKQKFDAQGNAGDTPDSPAAPQFLRPALNRPNLAAEVADQAQRARDLAGDLSTKANDFFEGLHWWLRGRYGEGPDVWGLAKSEEVLKDPSQLVWLYMPSEIPFPTDPAEDGITQVPRFERRHLYTWAWEDRKFRREAARDSGIAGRKEYELPFFW